MICQGRHPYGGLHGPGPYSGIRNGKSSSLQMTGMWVHVATLSQSTEGQAMLEKGQSEDCEGDRANTIFPRFLPLCNQSQEP